MSPQSLQIVFDPGARLCRRRSVSAAYQLATSRLPSFGQLTTGPSPQAFAAVPLLMLAAPFLIMRNTLIGRREESRRFRFVFLATVIAGFWSLMSGLVLVRAVGLFLA